MKFRVSIPFHVQHNGHPMHMWWPWEGEASTREGAVLAAYTVFNNQRESATREHCEHYQVLVEQWMGAKDANGRMHWERLPPYTGHSPT